jgi:hypothetical protein
VLPVPLVRPVKGDHEYDVAPEGVRICEPAEHIVEVEGDIETTGKGETVTRAYAVSIQPAELVPVTVYVVVDAGVAVTVEPALTFKPAVGVHAYVEPPFAVKVTEFPAQIAELVGLTVTVGLLFTTTITIAVSIHPELVPVTVYVVVDAGVAVTEAVLVLFRPVDGFQVKDEAPPAVRVTEPPEQTELARGETVTLGFETTETTEIAVPTQPFVVPLTVYDVVEEGVALTIAEVLLLNPETGVQL